MKELKKIEISEDDFNIIFYYFKFAENELSKKCYSESQRNTFNEFIKYLRERNN